MGYIYINKMEYYSAMLLLRRFSHVWLLATPWTAAYQAPPSMGFSGQQYWSGVPLPSPTQPYKSEIMPSARMDGFRHYLTKWRPHVCMYICLCVCIYTHTPHLYPLICWWTLRLLTHLGYVLRTLGVHYLSELEFSSFLDICPGMGLQLHVCMRSCFICVQLLATLWTVEP